MAVYFQATIELRAEGIAKFLQTMEMVLPIAERAGWKLVGAYMQRTGRLHTVIDVWELEDYNHYDRGLKAIAADERFPQIAAALAETVERETTVFMERAPYMR
jgi:hypothetical protein